MRVNLVKIWHRDSSKYYEQKRITTSFSAFFAFLESFFCKLTENKFA